MDSETEYESALIDPYRDDPVWEEVYASAIDVQGWLFTSCSEYYE
jgi:hypothetical protein